ncbi:DUF3784 domain-containing protein [Bacillus sp. JJ1122]|uniref:DUF3784 domain-containing protein n=1 Tax=Bacillus sp. JJ1122 TaxID=3122951 RepID=UPI0030009FD9
MGFLIGVQLFLIVMFLLLGWAIVKKDAYWLISNFNGRTEDEQKQLIENGFPQRVGKLMLATAAGMAILLPLSFTSFTYSMEIQFGFMLVFLLGGLIYLSKYEVKSKRKRSYIISSVLAIVTIGFLIVISFLGYQNFEIKTNQDSFEITGMYGDVWKYDEIQSVELLDEMPEVTWKQNGFGLATMSKGQFRVKNFGSSLLFIHKGSSPYLYIELEGKKVFINSKNPEQTKKWYILLSEITKKGA